MKNDALVRKYDFEDIGTIGNPTPHELSVWIKSNLSPDQIKELIPTLQLINLRER
ncbi:MAG: hypothetical protein ACKVHR_12610 [Pirellulales bacterium]|jgi:hypothetical protein